MNNRPGSWEKALVYLTTRSRTEKQVKDYLLRKGYPEDDILETIKLLKSMRYLDDSAYANGFCRARATYKYHGSHRLRRDLISRGIPRKIADEAITDVFSQVDEREVLLKAISKWERKNGNPKTKNDLKRLHNYLFRLGFEPSVIMDNLPDLRGSDEEQ